MLLQPSTAHFAITHVLPAFDMSLQGGDKLIKVLADMTKKLEGEKVLSVGFLSGAKYPDGTPVAAVAFWNEFGHGGRFPAPPRPFFRSMISEESGSWPAKIAGAIKYADYDAEKALYMVGKDIEGALFQSIESMNSPELSPTTKMLREIYGNNPQEIRARDVLAAQELVDEGYQGVSGTGAKPLVWTGHMQKSIQSEVKNGS